MELSCIEWRKARYSSGANQNCVEAGAVGRVLAVRDSKDPDGPVLAVAPRAWRAFIERVKAGAPGPA